MDYTTGPVDPVDPSRDFVARTYTDEYQGLLAQFQRDAGGAGVTLDGARATLADAAGVDVDAALTPDEADLAASQDDDDSALRGLSVTDELSALDSQAPAVDNGVTSAADVSATHDGMTSWIDTGVDHVPVPPPDLPPDNPWTRGDWAGHTGKKD